MCWFSVFTLPYLCNFLLCQRLTIEEKFYLVCSLLVLTQKCLHHSQMFFSSSSVVDWIGSPGSGTFQFEFPVCYGIRQIAIGMNQEWWQFSESGKWWCIVSWLYSASLASLAVFLELKGALHLTNFWKSVLRHQIIWFRSILICLLFEVDRNGWWQNKERAGVTS